MGSGEYALKEKDASVHVGVSEADFSVMFNDKETRMIELKSLAVFTTCAFMNLENVAIGDVQLSLKSCRVDLISTSLLPFISRISATVKSLLLVSRAYKEQILDSNKDSQNQAQRPVAPLSAYVEIKDIELNFGGRT